MQGLNRGASVVVQQTSDEGVLRPDIPCAGDGCKRASR